MKKTVIIVAGGKGYRMGGDLPKQFIPFHGKPVLMRSIEAFYRWNTEAHIVVVIPVDHAEYWKMLCREMNFSVIHHLLYGGKTRFHSVQNGLFGVDADGLIAVHDGVRPFVSPDVISSCFKMAETHGSAIPVVPMIDSVREIIRPTGNDEAPASPSAVNIQNNIYEKYASRAIDRNRLCIVQTPQVFRADILHKAYKQPYDENFTDDATVVEASGFPIYLVEGNRENIKITTSIDLK